MVAKAQKLTSPKLAMPNATVRKAGSVRVKRTSVPAMIAYQNWNEAFVKANPGERIAIIRGGAKAEMLAGGSEFFNISANNFQRIIGIPPATASRKIRTKSLLGPAESERLARVALIEAEAEEVFGSQDVAKDWLLTKNNALGDVPLELLDTEIGAMEVKKVLSAIAYGGAV